MIGPHGCGKTLTFLLPVLTRIWMQEIALSWADTEEPFVIIVTTPENKSILIGLIKEIISKLY